MTILQCLAVRDDAIGFNRPIFTPSVALATRSFTDEVNRNAPDNDMFRHPESFSLWHLATFDDDTGLFSLLPTPTQIITASNVKTTT